MVGKAGHHVSFAGWMSLIVMVVKTTVIVIMLRHARTSLEKPFNVSVVVASSEVVKFIASLVAVLFFSKAVPPAFRVPGDMSTQLPHRVGLLQKSALPMVLPATLYLFQNIILFVAAGQLSALVFQVAQGSKIFFTAVFTSTLLGRSLKVHQWVAQPMLAAGMVLLSLRGGNISSQPSDNLPVGLALMTVGCCVSSFTGVIVEKYLKSDTDPGLWVRNCQLSFYSSWLGFAYAVFVSGASAQPDGMWQGFDHAIVVGTVFVQALSGITIAFVLKYADNILKNFASAASAILTAVTAYFAFGEVPGVLAGLGAGAVMFAVLTYSGVLQEIAASKE
ncbi:unnamed protein product [Pedinophyceae sp. YPF-701]|nr:unnamed protein product [Pedinophyceae sp. YPF-701]